MSDSEINHGNSTLVLQQECMNGCPLESGKIYLVVLYVNEMHFM